MLKYVLCIIVDNNRISDYIIYFNNIFLNILVITGNDFLFIKLQSSLFTGIFFNSL